MMATLLAWIAHKLESSKSLTRYVLLASWRAVMAADLKWSLMLKACVISWTRCWKGNLSLLVVPNFIQCQMAGLEMVLFVFVWIIRIRTSSYSCLFDMLSLGYLKAPEPGVFLFLLGIACFWGAFSPLDFLGAPPAASNSLSVLLST